MSDSASYTHSIRSYVLRQGRETKAQRRAWTLWANDYQLPARLSPPDWAAVFSRQAPLIVEIGCGYGEATALIAAANPDNNYVVFEVHRPGIGALWQRLALADIKNVRVICVDAMRTIPFMFTKASIAGINLFFPDPWPKRRHHKRRLIRPTFINILAEKMIEGGIIHMATDWLDYADEASTLLAEHPMFSPATIRRQQRPATAYERRAWVAGRTITELHFRRVHCTDVLSSDVTAT